MLVFSVWAGVFYWRSLRGARPVSNGNIYNVSNSQVPETNQSIDQSEASLMLPDNFSIEVLERNLGDARVIIPDMNGNLLVSRSEQGIVTLIRIENGSAVGKEDVFQNLNNPHGLALDPQNKNILFIGEENNILRADLSTKGQPQKVIDLPAGGRHTTRNLLFGPDGRLYASIGSSCDTCVERDQRRAAIYSLNKDGSDFKLEASGLRNSVFMKTNPETNEIWATEMGRDFLGDNLPPDEVNIIKSGRDYGWPYCYGKNVHDNAFDPGNAVSCSEKEPSLIDIPAHSAPLGLDFIPSDSRWPEEMRGDLIVAYHGSWNRSEPTGYKLVRFDLNEGGALQNESGVDFVTGWLRGGESQGRPVSVLIRPNGVMYVSDDKAGVIYKIEYREP